MSAKVKYVESVRHLVENAEVGWHLRISMAVFLKNRKTPARLKSLLTLVWGMVWYRVPNTQVLLELAKFIGLLFNQNVKIIAQECVYFDAA